ncbi:MAG: hypothetical protein ACI865_002529 [Flavobacteriaceae bacterium]|jgi:hypothetical protein
MKPLLLLLISISVSFPGLSQHTILVDTLAPSPALDLPDVLFIDCAHGHICCQAGCGCCTEMFRPQIFDTVKRKRQNGVKLSIVEERFPIASFHNISYVQYVFDYSNGQKRKRYFSPKALRRDWLGYSVNSYHENDNTQNHKKLFSNETEFVLDSEFDLSLIDLSGNELPIPFHSQVKIQDNVFRSSIIINNRRIYGLSDSLGNKLGKLAYRSIRFDAKNEIAVAQSFFDRGYSLIDLKGNLIIPSCMYEITRLKDNLYSANGSLYQSDGTKITTKPFDFIGKLREGLISIRTEKGIGFINAKGREIIKPQFAWAYDFHSGRAAVYNGDKWGFIDTTGTLVIPFLYDQVRNYNEGLSIVAIGQNTNKDRWGIINKSGNYILEPTYDELHVFKDGLAKAFINGQGTGFVNKKGKEVIPCSHSSSIYGSKDSWFPLDRQVLRRYKPTRTHFLADKKGKKVLDLDKYSSARILQIEGSTLKHLPYLIVSGRTGNYGLLDFEGNIIIDTLYSSMHATNDAILSYTNDQKVCLYNINTCALILTINGMLMEHFHDSIGKIRKPDGQEVFVRYDGEEIEIH